MREAEKAVLRNFYLLAQDHDHQMKVKDDLIRELMTHKTDLEKSLHEAQNDQSLYKMAKASLTFFVHCAAVWHSRIFLGCTLPCPKLRTNLWPKYT